MHSAKSVVLNRLHCFCKSGLYCDVRFQLGEEYVPAHSLILSAVSSFVMEKYGKLNEGVMNINIEGPTELQCIDCLTTVLDFIYGQDFEIDSVHLPHIHFIMTALQILPIFVNAFENSIQPNQDREINDLKIFGSKQTFLNNSEVMESDEHFTINEKKDVITNDKTFIKGENDLLEVCIVDLDDNEINPSKVFLSINNSQMEVMGTTSSKEKYNQNRLDLKSHGNSRLQNCLECGYQCYKPSDLLSHLQEADHNEKVCSLCFSKFECNKVLREHLTKHNHSKPFFCILCEQRFQTRALLAQHLPKHSSETPYLCPYCKKGFKWKHGLNSHLIVHTKEKKHLCDECGYSTPHAKTLRAHKLTHTGNVFRCPFPSCTHTSVRKENMKIHQVTHVNDRPFVCEICGHKFTQNKNLKRHLLTHEKNSLKIHLCSHCTFTTFRTDKLKAHIDKQHSGTHVQISDENYKIPCINDSMKTKNYTRTSNISSTPSFKNDLTVLADAASSCFKLQDVPKVILPEELIIDTKDKLISNSVMVDVI